MSGEPLGDGRRRGHPVGSQPDMTMAQVKVKRLHKVWWSSLDRRPVSQQRTLTTSDVKHGDAFAKRTKID
jgi:hypothetical protein